MRTRIKVSCRLALLLTYVYPSDTHSSRNILIVLCLEYGQCGIGAYCLGGCDPLFSFDLKSCVPAATCKTQDYQLKDLNDVQSINDYLGDYSSTNWVASGNPAAYSQGGTEGILLTMAEDTVGTLMATTHYVWYGQVSATLQTSQGAGVVTAFILMSDVKDEIDFEFVGVDTGHAQSNFYSQGVTNCKSCTPLIH